MFVVVVVVAAAVVVVVVDDHVHIEKKTHWTPVEYVFLFNFRNMVNPITNHY